MNEPIEVFIPLIIIFLIVLVIKSLSNIYLQIIGWWSYAGSNRGPLECHSSALPAEL